MTTPHFSTTATRFVQAFGATAHGAIDACQAAGEQLGRFAAARWDSAYAQARAQLSPETRRNATRTRKVVARCWREGLAVSGRGADAAVDALVQAAEQAIGRAEAWSQSRHGRA